MIVGSGDFKYKVVENWPKWPKGWVVNNICGIAQNSKGVIYIFNRGEHPVIMVTPEGEFIGSWGEDYFKWPHGISVTKDDCLWFTDMVLHTAAKFTANGKLLMELGNRGKPSDSGCKDFVAYWQVTRGAGPFNQPTKATESPWGDIYVTDGYGNARVHCFSPDGKLKFSWGEPGSGPGQFKIPHDIVIDDKNILYVTEMENIRIQLFTREGKFMKEWKGIERPSGLFMDKRGNFFVTEICEQAKFPGIEYPPLSPTPHVRIMNHDGKTIAMLAGAPDDSQCCAPGYFYAPHACCVDADDNLYIGEPIYTLVKQGHDLSPDCHAIQKLVRIK